MGVDNKRGVATPNHGNPSRPYEERGQIWEELRELTIIATDFSRLPEISKLERKEHSKKPGRDDCTPGVDLSKKGPKTVKEIKRQKGRGIERKGRGKGERFTGPGTSHGDS